MSSSNIGTASVLKEQQPKAEFTHCRSHCLNLSVTFACKNVAVRNFMDTLTSASNFFKYSGKRQQYFELFIDYYQARIQRGDLGIYLPSIFCKSKLFKMFKFSGALRHSVGVFQLIFGAQYFCLFVSLDESMLKILV